jgi:hypothetical protein
MYEFMVKKLKERNYVPLSKTEKSKTEKDRAVGPGYELDYDRIADEIFQIMLESRQRNGDFGMDAFKAYEEWESRNYSIIRFDEHGYEDYDFKLIDMVENKVIDYDRQMQRETMDKVFDLEYNDLVKFKDGEYYVKSTNDKRSYNGCMIWAGPEKDSEHGWYISVSDFIKIIERSNSGERLF